MEGFDGLTEKEKIKKKSSKFQKHFLTLSCNRDRRFFEKFEIFEGLFFERIKNLS